MANADRPKGFEPYGEVKKSIKMVAGAAVYPGDCVILSADGKVDPASAGGDIFGVALTYAAADGDDVMVSCDPHQQYIVQADETEVNVQADIGQVTDIVATAGNTTYKISRQELDSSLLTTASGGQLTLLGIEPAPDNALGGQVNCKVVITQRQAIGETDFGGV